MSRGARRGPSATEEKEIGMEVEVAAGLRGPNSARGADPVSVVTKLAKASLVDGSTVFVSKSARLMLGGLGPDGTLTMPDLRGNRYPRQMRVQFDGHVKVIPNEKAELIERMRKHRSFGKTFFDLAELQQQSKTEKIRAAVELINQDPEVRAALEVELGRKAIPLPPREEAEAPAPTKSTRRAKPATPAD